MGLLALNVNVGTFGYGLCGENVNACGIFGVGFVGASIGGLNVNVGVVIDVPNVNAILMIKL
jgi:hypothetical protein